MTRTSLPNYAFITCLGLISCATIAFCLIHFVKLKNQQINLSRQIERVDDRIAEAKLDIRMEQLAKSRLLNRFELAQRLKEQDSKLQAIGFENVITLPFSERLPSDGLAAARP